MLKNVAALLLDDVNPFELGVLCEVFGLDRSEEGLPVHDFAVVSAEGPVLRTHAGFTITTPTAWTAWKRPTSSPSRPAPTSWTGSTPRRSWRRCAGPWTAGPGC